MKWISVKDKHPKGGETVLIYMDRQYERVAVGFFLTTDELTKYKTWFEQGINHQGDIHLRDGVVTHWMPLPKPPESTT